MPDNNIHRSMRSRKAEKIAVLAGVSKDEVLSKWDKCQHYCKRHGWYQGTRCKLCRDMGK